MGRRSRLLAGAEQKHKTERLERTPSFLETIWLKKQPITNIRYKLKDIFGFLST